MEKQFKINFLDHVALRVRDASISAKWYQEVLGLKKYTTPEWGEFPIFLLAGKSGLALFPLKDAESNPSNPNYDHFAFNVDNENFEKAKSRLKVLNVEFQFQDHQYFHSIYFRDPDNNKVELTTLVAGFEDFYD